ncbi:MAG: SusC/RagA family TonB-linked outer membrane protein [Bacteroidales bacterium]
MRNRYLNGWLLAITMFFFATFISISLHAQEIDAKGIVKTKTGDPLIGATVVIKGTTQGVSTNQNGEFSIPAHLGDSIQISFMGFDPQTVLFNGKRIEIMLSEESIAMEDVVVVGYGSVKKSDLTGSVSTVKVKNLNSTPANSIDGLLQGRSAGLQVINSSQDPGSGSTVRIRGESSLYGSNSPLLVVDGFPMGDAGNLKQINPSDIKSIEVLKDASASAIYGSRGANGVIIVTTNRASEGLTRINIKQQTSISQFSSKLNIWRNVALMAQLSNEQRINAGYQPLYNGTTQPNGVYYPSVEEIISGSWPYYTRWDDVVFRDAPITNNTVVNILSANKTTSFNLSANYFDEQGMYIEDVYKKGIVNLSVNHKVNDFFSISTSNNLTRGFRHYNADLAYYRSPLWPVYNDDGTYFLAGSTDYTHPMALTDLRKNETKTLDLLSSLQADIKFCPWLSLKSQLNYKYGTYVTDTYYPDVYSSADSNNGQAGIANWLDNYIVSETYLTFDKKINEDHSVTAMVGNSYEYYMTRSSGLTAYNFVNESLGNENMGAGDPEMNELSNSLSKSKLVSFMSRVNYAFKNRYLATLTMRADGSTKFGANNKWAYFPSGAISWKAHEENFIKDLNIFDELKFRASYGISGNQGIAAYQTLSKYGTEEYYYNGSWQTTIGPGYVSGLTGDDYRFKVWSGIPNEDLKWETTSQYDIGFDIAVLNNRLQLVLDYYVKNTSDLLRQKNLPLSSGYDLMWVNDGEIENKGFEFTVTGDILRNKDYSLSATLIYSRNRNKVIDLGNAVATGLQTDPNTGMKYEFWGSSLSTFSEYPNILAIGKAVNVFYGYKVDGIIQSEAEGLAAGLTGDEAQPGEFKYVDINDDGEITDDDRTIIGNPNPDFTMSLSLNGRYKNFDMEIFLNGVFGNDVLYQNMWGGQPNTMPLRWTQDNPNNSYPSLREDRKYHISNWYVKDGSFVRIQNISIGYNFKFEKLKWLDNLRCNFNVSNLYTFTKFKGYDPEVGSNGIYYGGYPRLRKWTFGLELTF